MKIYEYKTWGVTLHTPFNTFLSPNSHCLCFAIRRELFDRFLSLHGIHFPSTRAQLIAYGKLSLKLMKDVSMYQNVCVFA